MDLLRWAHLFPHEDDIAIIALLGVWEGPALPALYQQLAQWNTNILLRKLVWAATMSRDDDKEHGV